MIYPETGNFKLWSVILKIESKDTDIESLLDGSYFHIPRFQRPYSWDDDNINDFWNDLIANKDEDYFIGSMVVYKRGKQQYGVVDGQQRLTTITILLCVLRDEFAILDRFDYAEGLHQLIERKDRDNKSEYVLRTETSFPYFQENIQKFGPADVNVKIRSEETNLQNAYDIFRKLVASSLDAIETDATVAQADKNNKKISKLTSIRNTVLNLNLIFVVLDSEDDAYLIFETLNTRGKDLAVSDLVKNHFAKHLKAKGSVDAAKLKWAEIMETIHNSSADISSDNFIYHFWSSRYEALPLKKIFPVFKRDVTKENAKYYMEALLSDSKIYRSIHEPSYAWVKGEIEASRSLAALFNIFKISQPTPAVLSLVRAYRDGKIKFAKLRDALKAVEKFHFVFTAITSSRSSGGISAMYSSFARKLFESNGPQEASNEIMELVIKLRNRRPSLEEFKVAFKEVTYTNSNSKQKNLVRYILRNFAEFEGYKYPVDFEDLTIEHIYPQVKVDVEGWTDDNIGQLANLMFLDQKMNEKVGVQDYAEKINILRQDGYVIPNDMLNIAVWDVAAMHEVNDKMATIAYTKIWNI